MTVIGFYVYRSEQGLFVTVADTVFVPCAFIPADAHCTFSHTISMTRQTPLKKLRPEVGMRSCQNSRQHYSYDKNAQIWRNRSRRSFSIQRLTLSPYLHHHPNPTPAPDPPPNARKHARAHTHTHTHTHTHARIHHCITIISALASCGSNSKIILNRDNWELRCHFSEQCH